MSVNKAIIIGNLGRDPESGVTKSGQSYCRLNVATSRQWNDSEGNRREETEWHRVTVWSKAADACAKYLKKGSKVYVEGRLKTSSYEKDGEKRYTTEILAEHVDFLDRKSNGEKNEGDSDWSTDMPARHPQGNSKPSMSDDDIPF